MLTPFYFLQPNPGAPATGAPATGAPATVSPEAAAADPTGGLWQTMIMMGGMVAIFYFLLIRPQNNRMKKHRAMLAAMKKGDTVITQGGIIGRIFKLGDEEVVIDTGEGGKLRIVRGMIVDVKGAGGPAPANDTKAS